MGIPRTRGLLYVPWQPLGIPSRAAIIPICHLHKSPPSPIPGDLGRGPSHHPTCSNIETRMDRPKSVVRVIRGVARLTMSAVFFLNQVLTYAESATSEYWTTSQCLSALRSGSGSVRFSSIYESSFIFSDIFVTVL